MFLDRVDSSFEPAKIDTFGWRKIPFCAALGAVWPAILHGIGFTQYSSLVHKMLIMLTFLVLALSPIIAVLNACLPRSACCRRSVRNSRR